MQSFTTVKLPFKLSQAGRVYVFPLSYNESTCCIYITFHKYQTNVHLSISNQKDFVFSLYYKVKDVNHILNNTLKMQTENIQSTHLDILAQPMGNPSEESNYKLINNEDIILSVVKDEENNVSCKNWLNVYLFKHKSDPKWCLVVTRTLYDKELQKKISRTKLCFVFPRLHILKEE